MESQEKNNYWAEIRNKLNSVSPSFCLAKWKHASLHLLNGRTHSCYLPPTHEIPLRELEKNPSALHNTLYKKQQRQQMLQGVRPKECSMCWTIEDLPGDQVSDRILRGQETWTKPYFNEVASSSWDHDHYPSYLEVSFSSLCNLRCSYCSPHVSSSWMDEIKKFGPYVLSESMHQSTDWFRKQKLLPLDENDNPYIEAFWNWWPDLYPKLQVFRITGGEPLLSKHTYKILEWIEANPHPNLELDINSNFSVPKNIFEKFFSHLEKIIQEKKIKRIRIHTSLDTWGKQAEYIRNGLDFTNFWQNIERYLQTIPTGELYFMCTFNALSVVGFHNFLDGLQKLRSRFENNNRKIWADIPHLTSPNFLSAKILGSGFLPQMHELSRIVNQKSFHSIEQEKIRRIISWMESPSPKDIQKHQKDFVLFFREHDKRRKTNFLATFPEMTSFWHYCESLL